MKELVTFETAKLARLKNFNLKVSSYYELSRSHQFIPKLHKPYKIDYTCLGDGILHNMIDRNHAFADDAQWYSAPTQTVLRTWLRENHNVDITVITNWIKGNRIYYVGISYVNDNNEVDIWFSKDDTVYKSKIEYKKYEDALEVGLQKSLEIIK